MGKIIKSKPILFNTEMVQAIIEDRKTNTRRVLKPSKKQLLWLSFSLLWKAMLEKIYPNGAQFNFPNNNGPLVFIKCPYKVGMTLWVRETFAIDDWIHSQDRGKIIYKTQSIDPDYPVKWKPSIFMPKAACRIFLEITNIRVEKVQEITNVEAEKEGIEVLATGPYRHTAASKINNKVYDSTINAFKGLWDSINEKRGYGWHKNPWVWVVEFKRKT